MAQQNHPDPEQHRAEQVGEHRVVPCGPPNRLAGDVGVRDLESQDSTTLSRPSVTR
jgi:hypothetical protein